MRDSTALVTIVVALPLKETHLMIDTCAGWHASLRKLDPIAVRNPTVFSSLSTATYDRAHDVGKRSL